MIGHLRYDIFPMVDCHWSSLVSYASIRQWSLVKIETIHSIWSSLASYTSISRWKLDLNGIAHLKKIVRWPLLSKCRLSLYLTSIVYSNQSVIISPYWIRIHQLVGGHWTALVSYTSKSKYIQSVDGHWSLLILPNFIVSS